MMTAHRIEERVIERAMAEYPDIPDLVHGSTPVVSFGNPGLASVVTVGINPSSNEFLVDGAGTPLLPVGKKRLTDTELLQISHPKRLNRDQAVKVVESCYNYFDEELNNPYMRWFKHLNENVNSHLGVNYRRGTAAHLDLVQWATDPVWGGIKSSEVKSSLLNQDSEFLRYQLNSRDYQVVFMNGREVKNQLVATGIAQVDVTKSITYQTSTGKTLPIEFFKGATANGSLALGWSKTFPGHYIWEKSLGSVVEQLHKFMDLYTK
jgi:hypothetical protein